MKNLIMLPRMYTWSNCETRPSRPVTVMSRSEILRLSSAIVVKTTNANERIEMSSLPFVTEEKLPTFCELSPIQLAGLEFDSDNVTKRFVEQLDGDAQTLVSHDNLG